MCNKFFISFFLLLITSNTQAQITKGNWLVGGNINFSSEQYESRANADYTRTQFSLNGVLGYFVMNNLAIGLKPSYIYTSAKTTNTPSVGKVLNIGPFVRYYFLPTTNRLNLFTEASYQYSSTLPADLKGNNFTIAVGPVVYLNSVVGVEFSLGYSYSKYQGYDGANKIIQAGNGLQIHLEKSQ
jgi:hypothetical protein